MRADRTAVALRPARAAAKRRRAGSSSIELLFLFPLLLALVLGMVEMSQILAAQQQLAAASREGARVASQGGDQTAVQLAVSQYLGQGTLSGAQVQAVLTDSNGNPLPSGCPVTVQVQIPAAQAVPDLLGFIGFGLGDRVIVGQTTMRKE